MTAVEIQNWMVTYLSNFEHLQSETIDINTSFDCYGLDSSAAMEMIFELEQKFQCRIDPTVFYYYSNIKDLAEHLVQVVNDSQTSQQMHSPSAKV